MLGNSLLTVEALFHVRLSCEGLSTWVSGKRDADAVGGTQTTDHYGSKAQAPDHAWMRPVLLVVKVAVFKQAVKIYLFMVWARRSEGYNTGRISQVVTAVVSNLPFAPSYWVYPRRFESCIRRWSSVMGARHAFWRIGGVVPHGAAPEETFWTACLPNGHRFFQQD